MSGLMALTFPALTIFCFEGNWAVNCDGDHTHGPSTYMTFYRNFCGGYRTPFIEPSNGASINDFTTAATSPSVRAAGPSAYNYWYAFIGNVLGTSGYSTTINGWVYDGNYTRNFDIYDRGYEDITGTQDPNLYGSSPYLERHGNYDYVNASVQWDSANSNHTLPDSFYLTSEPSFFTTASGYTWPWVNPVGSTSTLLYTLPAQARFGNGTPFVQPVAPIPVISNATASLRLPVTNGEAVNTMTATYSPISWAVTSCSASCTGYFAIDNSGNVTVTPTGARNLCSGNLQPHGNSHEQQWYELAWN